MLTADPTRHDAVQLTSHCFINFVTRVGEFAHSKQCTSLQRPRKLNPLQPNKLLLSKWTAVEPRAKEKHFLVAKLVDPELDGGKV